MEDAGFDGDGRRDSPDLYRVRAGPGGGRTGLGGDDGPVAELAVIILPPAAHGAVLKEGAGVITAGRHRGGRGNPDDFHRGGVGDLRR